jgi:GAF domain-containing protein
MREDPIPKDLKSLLEEGGSDDVLLTRLSERYARSISADRCILFLRNPDDRRSKATHEWVRAPRFRFRRGDRGWVAPSATLLEDDPMFAEALRNPVALYIEDVEAADPALVNREYERAFGHRALIHAPFYHAGKMFGILEPCVFDEPRVWSETDRLITAWVQERFAPHAAAYVAANCR